MPAWLCILTAALIYVFAVSPAAAVLLGRVIRLADSHETPPPGVLGEAAPARRAHLSIVREVSS